MRSEPTLYAFPGSLCSQKVRLVLAEKGVPYESRVIDIELRMQNYEPGYLRLNPRGVVPTLVHGDAVVTDSARILRYVDEHFDGPRLVPEDAAGRERMDHWIAEQDGLGMRELSYASMRGALGLMLRRVSMPLRQRKLRRLKAAHPDLADLYDAKLEDVRGWRAAIVDEATIRTTRNHTAEVLRAVEAQLGSAPHLAGEAYSLADVAWTCILARLKMLGLAEIFFGRNQCPGVAAYYERQLARPSFAAAGIWEATPSGRDRIRLARAMRAAAAP